MSSDKVNVLYIGGVGRSGSTLIDLIVGQADGFFSAGELRWVWERSFVQNQLTSTQEPFRESPFWQDVVKEAYGGFDKIDPERIEKLREKVDRFRYVPQMMTGRYSKTYKPLFDEYANILKRLYIGIQAVTGCRYIIDSSKNSPHAYILNTIPEIDVYMAHLIRDSRAFAYSWQRKKLRPEIHWKEAHMANFSLRWCARRWNNENFFIPLMQTTNKRYTMMRYEDFVENPQRELDKLWDLVGEPHHDTDALIARLQSGEKEIHSVSGNPIRFQKEGIKIRADYEWKEKLTFQQKAYMTTFTSPLLLRYGYLF